jgi:hypothetical protein
MPISSRTRIIRLTKWFPPNDPLAAKMARLCILREDFLLEMNGVFTERIDELDGHSQEWRRLYFIRNLIRTLREIEAGIQRLFTDAEFKALLAKQPDEVQREFAEHAARMADGIGTVKEIRDDICGHVQETAVQEALGELAGTDIFGLLETGPTMRRTFFKFADELVVQILVRGAPDAHKHAVFTEKIETIGGLLYSFGLIESALQIYIEDRGLLPERK